MAVDAVYHRKCHNEFWKTSSSKSSIAGRPVSQEVTTCLNTIFKYLEEIEDCQFSLSDLSQLINDSLDSKIIKRKLIERYGDNIIITSNKRKVPTVCFRNSGHKILSDSWYQKKHTSEKEERLRIIKKAAEILRDDIATTVYDNDTYPNSYGFLNDVEELIPESLKYFLENLILKNKKCKNIDGLKKKCSTIAHSIIASIKPRTFNSPILLAVGSFIFKKIGSKTLINLLSQIGICSSYHDVKVLETSLIMVQNPL